MKIKFLPLLLILTGILVISGCVDREAQPFTSKAPEDLYMRIFYPYSEPLDHQDPGIPDSDVPEMRPYHPPEGSGYVLVVHNLGDATSLLDSNIEKAEIITLRLEEGIQYYKAEGKDVSKLEGLFEKYNLSVEEAKNYKALADAMVDKENNSTTSDSDLGNQSSEDIRREYLIRSQKSIIQANIVLKEIFKEFQRLVPGVEEINSTSKLSAAGDGIVSLFGNFTLNLHLEEGDIAMQYLSSDSEIQITGDYVFEEKTEMQNKVRLYHIHSADLKISGSRKTVQLRGANITLNVSEGEGSAFFLGNGTYRIEAQGRIIKEQKWARPPFPKEGTNSDKYDTDKKENDTTIGHRKRAMSLKEQDDGSEMREAFQKKNK